MALDAWAPGRRRASALPYASVDAALAALRAGDIDAAMVPIENSVEGGVSATLDALASGDPLVVTGEVLVPVTFVLAARPGTRLGDVRAVGTHSHAWAQVRGWMAANLPDAVVRARRCRPPPPRPTGLAAGRRRRYDAAVCAPVAATIHGLEVLADDIGDNGRRGDPVRARRPARARCPRRPAPTRRPWSSSSATTTPVACSSCSSSSPRAAST